MDKVTKQRDPKRQAAGRKGHEKYMAKLKEDILKNVGSSNGGSSSSNSTNSGINTTNDSTNGGINTTNDSTNGGSDATSTTTSSTITNYIYGVGTIAVLSLGVCVFIKLMRNLSQPDKDPEKISKERKRSLKSNGKCYNKTRCQHHHLM